MTLILKPAIEAAIRRHLAQAHPEEGCGVLIGTDHGNERRIERAEPLSNRNPDERATRYAIAPEDFLEAEKGAREHGLEVLGFYHSHPEAGPEPSGFDRRHAWPWYSYLIARTTKDGCEAPRAWRLAAEGGAFVAEHVEVR